MMAIPAAICFAQPLFRDDLTGFKFIVECLFIHLGSQLTDLLLKRLGSLKIRIRAIQNGFKFSVFNPDLIP
jgi:hypothetical protein